ncbi:putative G-protein coupled receptor No18 [Tachypleus tridentatus]|uniref:putative G-protein coupled receptor No18 n=1 Tax=Tachypleus tridentatus TaxID=6853 RepID=UPI003FD61E38
MENIFIDLRNTDHVWLSEESVVFSEIWLNSSKSTHFDNSSGFIFQSGEAGASLGLRILGAILCVLIISLTLVGNILVILVIFRFRRLRSVTNLLLASLATADITVALLVMPLLVVYDVERHWRFGPVACHLWISCDVMCCTASILHLCVIALDRFWAITKPLRYRSCVSKKRVMMAIGIIWLCSGAISFIPIFMGWYSENPVSIFDENTECSLNVNRVYAVISSVTSFYLPLPVMFYVYFRILLIAERQAREIRQIEKSLEGADHHVKRSLRRQSRQLLTDTKAIRTLGIVMGVFCICWLPFFLMYVILAYCEQCYLEYEWRSAITWLGYFNSSFNPCIYAFLNREFKSAFRRVLGCKKKEDPEVTFLDDISSASRCAQRFERLQPETMDLNKDQNCLTNVVPNDSFSRDSRSCRQLPGTDSQVPSKELLNENSRHKRKELRPRTEVRNDKLHVRLAVPGFNQSSL